MSEAVIIDAVRTPVGRYGGALASVRPDDLCAHVVRAAVERNELDPATVDEVYMGCTNAAGEDNRNVARMAGLLAGLPVEVPGVTVNRLCASGLEAVNQAGRALRLGDGSLMLAGGVESMSRSPFVALKPERAFPRGNIDLVDTTIGWRFINPNMEYSTESMGETAENVAERYGVSREDQDAFALESHRRAAAATDEGRFDDELVTVDVPQRKGEPITVYADEGIRADATLEKLAKLRPAFREGGSVTAGNSSQINDGAACLVLATEERASELGREPLARIVSVGAAGVDPAVMGVGPIPASRLALERAGLGPDDIGLVELNEAFASQAVASMRELGLDHEKVNVNGGGIALGHPLGCSGARLLGTLVWEMRRRGVRYGLATMCIGVGQGLATIVENPAAAASSFPRVIDFELTDEQRLIRETAKEFADNEIVPRARDNDRNEHFDLELVKKLGDMGFLGAIVSEEYGGRGIDYRTYALIVEEVGRGDSSARTVVSVQTSLVCSSIERWGTEEQKKQWLPKLCTGEILGCFGLTEPNTGSDAANLSTRAKEVDGGWSISGQKQWISMGNFAKVALIFAQTDPEKGHRGLAAFLVDTDTEGFSSSEIHGKLGLRASDTAELALDEVKVPADAMLGEVGDGFKVAMSALDSGRYSVAAGCVGICQGCVDALVAYSTEREQFNRPLAAFQLVQEMIADMVVDLDASRALVWKAGWLKDTGQPNTRETSVAKLYATEAAVRSANNAIQVHGGSGYVDDYPVERYLRDARVTTLYEGTSQIQKLIIGRAVTGVNAMTP